MKYDVAIVGGGAAGLACAVRLTEKTQLKIVIIEASDRLGKKLAATGNGQGNVSNADMNVSHYFGSGKSIAEKIACANSGIYTEIFDCLFTEDSQGRIYPSGRQASALTDSVLRKLKGKADIMLSTKICDIVDGFVLTAEGGKKIAADKVVLCVGGKAQKQFKTDGSSYKLAACFGHKITALYPSLVQIKTDAEFIKALKGIRVDCNASAKVYNKIEKAVRGDVIFTEYGISGNASFSLSPYITDKPSAVIALEFLPDISRDEILDNISRRQNSGYATCDLLSGTLHNKLGKAIIDRAKSGDVRQIVNILKKFELNVSGTLGFDYAQVTRGGVDFGDVSDELESSLVKNLFFAGEMLDVDGDCGGYNLHWAFASGLSVADAIIKRYD